MSSQPTKVRSRRLRSRQAVRDIRNTPGGIRTCNLRLRRPVISEVVRGLYPSLWQQLTLGAAGSDRPETVSNSTVFFRIFQMICDNRVTATKLFSGDTEACDGKLSEPVTLRL